MFKMTCSDSKSVEWIIEVTNKIPPLEGRTYCAHRGNELPKLLTMTTHCPRKGGRDFGSTRHILQRSNPHLNISSWKVYWGFQKENTLQMLYVIPESEVKKLREAEYSAFFGLSTVACNHARYTNAPPGRVGYQGVKNLPANQPPNNPRSEITNPTTTRQTAEPLIQNRERESSANKSHRQRTTNKHPSTQNNQSTRPNPIQNKNHHNQTSRNSPAPITHKTPINSPKSTPTSLMSLKFQTPPRRGALLPYSQGDWSGWGGGANPRNPSNRRYKPVHI
jgi:hypothetical protein